MNNHLTDPIVKLVLIAGMVVIALSLVVLGMIVWIRLWRMVKDRRRSRFIGTWRSLLAQSVVEMPTVLPAIPPVDRLDFFRLWNHFQESLVGESKDNLNRIARLAGADQVALRLLARGRVRERLLAITALGHLRERAAWDALRRLATYEHASLALAAARALIRIDAAQAMSVLAPLFGARTDWSFVKGAAILNEAGAEMIARPLAQAAASAPPEPTVRLVRYLEATRCRAALPVVRRIAQDKATDDQVLAVCLRLFGQFEDPLDLDIIRAHLAHPNWHVRIRAAAALGRMGMQEDEARLIVLLTDPEWWVRYRAAEALASLPFITRERLAEIRAEQTVLQAKDILAPFVNKRGSSA